MSFDTHDYQLEAVTHILDGEDVLFTTATGIWKTNAFIRLIHVIIMLSENPSLAPSRNFPPDPAMLAIYSTKALEYVGLGLTNVVINQDTVAAAWKASNDDSSLFKKVCEETAIILLSLEHLESSGFRSVVDDKAFSARLYVMVVDEAHLIDLWGLYIRPSYKKIVWMRSRAGRHVHMFCCNRHTAKKSEAEVLEFLGFRRGHYHVIRRSNLRSDIRIIFRIAKSGVSGTQFPKLRWILDCTNNFLIFVPTVHMAFRVHDLPA